MPTETMKRPAGVTLAAVVLALMAAVGALFAALSIAVLFLQHHPIIPKIPTVRIFVVCFDLFMLLILVWSIWTVIGLFQSRPWARFSMLALGALQLCFFGVQSIGLLFLRSHYDFSMMLPAGPGGIHVSALMLEIAALDALLALIGVWWLVYFSLTRVRLAFGAHHNPV